MTAPIERRPQDSGKRASRATRGRRIARMISRVFARRISLLLGNAAFLLLGLAVVALGAALMSQRIPAGSAAHDSAAQVAESQAASQMVNAPAPPSDWIPLRSTRPADILAAARQSTLFQQNLAGNGDHVRSLSQLGSPVLVRAFQPSGAPAGQYPDFYVVPILNASGAVTDAAELALNPGHTAVQVIAIVTYTAPHPHGALAHMSSAAALKAMQAQQHSALRSGTAPQLVYFPADATAQETSAAIWTGGGEFPADPIWLVSGADGRNHLVGSDGRAYYPEQLPMIKTRS